MKRSFLISVLVCVVGVAGAQNRSIGLRLGNPIGVTYKQYAGDKAMEFIIGTTNRSWGDRYYRNSFEYYDNYSGYYYRTHTVERLLSLQGRYVVHSEIPVEGMIGDLNWYWGLGAFLRAGRVEYLYYREAQQGSPGRDIRTNVDLGPEGILGTEYKFDDLPLIVFGEASMGVELLDRPNVHVFGGLGIRYLF